MHTTRRADHITGYTLIHMVMALSLLGVFVLISSRLFVGTLETTQQAQRQHRRVFLSERVAHQLRRDAWRAQSIAAAAPTKVTLQTPRQRITWQTLEDKALRRTVVTHGTSRKDKQRFDLKADLRFESDGPLLRVRSSDQTVSMLSQSALWEAQQ